MWLLAAAALLATTSVRAEDNAPAATGVQKAPNPGGGSKEDEFTAAQRLINGAAGNPECVWIGRKAVNRLWSDDIDTAFRYIDLYDRFGCPGAHIQAAVRCIVLHQPVDPKSGDHKPSDTLEFRVDACWNNPTSPAIPAVAPAAAAAPAPAPAAPAAPAPSQTSTH
ncbi:MAG TPA: beta-1-3, beta-1-6-glucan biosynthesis protein [Xanthobacteraceae bacterium]|nr:beta-1-3, beta-1-6-glucan biosynthesis protein [Xanthobacteraceae bacterium]